jgi:IS66 C-terminal element
MNIFWLGSRRPDAGTLASFTTTCELLKLNPWTYLRDVLATLPTTPAIQLVRLLPTI